VEPFAVDVASGVEKSPRRKDYEKVKQFIINVRMAEKRKK
jgi:phosphoribosylanthranilate isomerase